MGEMHDEEDDQGNLYHDYGLHPRYAPFLLPPPQHRLGGYLRSYVDPAQLTSSSDPFLPTKPGTQIEWTATRRMRWRQFFTLLRHDPLRRGTAIFLLGTLLGLLVFVACIIGLLAWLLI